MADKRSVDELSIEELERILAIKKREARQQQRQRMQRQGRTLQVNAPANPAQSTGLALDDLDLADHSIIIPEDKPRFIDGVDLPNKTKRRKRQIEESDERSSWDRLLLILEITAGIGVIAVIAMLASTTFMTRDAGEYERTLLENERFMMQTQSAAPTAQPTPVLRLANVVLPSGHTPPNENGSTFNYDEIPENLRSLIREEIYPAEITRPPVTAETARRIIIPDINVDHPIVQGVDWEALRLGVGQLQNGITPTQIQGNVVLAAHNDIFGEIFRYLDRLEPGMQFQIITDKQVYTYVITRSAIVDPNDVYVMDNVPGKATATLISCYPYQVNNKRYIIFAERVDT